MKWYVRLVLQIVAFVFSGFVSLLISAILVGTVMSVSPPLSVLAALAGGVGGGALGAWLMGYYLDRRFEASIRIAKLRAEAAAIALATPVAPPTLSAVAPKKRPTEPSVAKTVVLVNASASAKKLGKGITPLGIALIWAVSIVAVVTVNQLLVQGLATSFVFDHQREIGGRYLVTRVDLPLTAVISSSYEISLTLQNVDAIDEITVIRPRIDGFCIINACTISIRRWELMAL